MGNRAYITLQKDQESRTYYVHWNGGPDIIYPMAQAILETKRELKVTPSFEDIEAAFFAFCSSKMEYCKDASHDWVEENGHYFIDLNYNSKLIRRFEVWRELQQLENDIELKAV